MVLVNSLDEPIKNAFTVDLEDWYQGIEIGLEDWGGFEDRLRIGTERLLALFDEAGVRATFFVLGYAAERAPDLMREIRARGHEIGTHGYSHRFVYTLGAEGFRSDLQRSLAVLEDALGESCVRAIGRHFFLLLRGQNGPLMCCTSWG